MSTIIELLVAVLVVLLNGFFVIAEFGLVRARKWRLQELSEQGNSKANLVLRVLDKHETYVSAIQLGITTSTVLFGIISGHLLVSLFAYGGQLEPVLAWPLSILLVVLLQVILGELVPRAIAVSNVERAVMSTIYPLIFFNYLLYPFVMISSKTSRFIQRILGLKRHEEDLSKSEEELRAIVSASEQRGKIDHLESRMIDNVFDFGDRVAREIMIPRQDMVCLFTDDSLADNLAAVRSSRHTRYPLCVEEKDNVIGLVSVRDMLAIKAGSTDFDLRRIMRPMVVVPEAMPISRALTMMQKKHVQMVLVADEYGGTAGLITIEDIVEEIVGDIQDEHEAAEPEDIVALPNGAFEFDGMVLLDDVAEELDIELDDPEEDTIGGYVFGLLGCKPEKDAVVESYGYSFKILEAEGFRVMRVLATPLPKKQKQEEEEAEDD